jgi:hypothetical protein
MRDRVVGLDVQGAMAIAQPHALQAQRGVIGLCL